MTTEATPEATTTATKTDTTPTAGTQPKEMPVEPPKAAAAANAATAPQDTPKEAPKDTPKAEEPKSAKGLINGEDDEESDTDPKAPTSEAPETYEDFKLPEGIKLDPANNELFKQTAKELGLSQEKAQKLVDLQSQFALEHQKKAMEEWQKHIEEKKNIAIKELGPEYKKELKLANKAVKALGSPELQKSLDETGLSNDVNLIRFLAKAGKMMSEDRMIEGQSGGKRSKDPAHILFPSMQ